MRVVVWQSASNTYYDVPDLILHGQNLVKVVSPELDLALKAPDKNWTNVVNLWFGEYYGHKINDAGCIVGSFWFIKVNGYGTWHAFRYTPAQGGQPAEFIDLGVPATDSYALAVNNDGDVVGHANGTACLWMNIGVDEKGFPVADTHLCAPGIANHLNDRDAFQQVQVAGSTDLGGSGGHGAHAFRYDSGTEVATPLGVLRPGAGEGSGGVAINDLGQVAGWSFATSTGNQHGYRYTDGAGMVDLGTLASSALASSSWDINNKGHVVGWADTSSRTRSVFLYTTATGMLNLAKLIDVTTLPPGATTSNIVIATHVSDDYVNPLKPDYQYQFGQICGYISVENMLVPFILTPDR
jgi:probable HAF family extracellular repeat protein